MQRGTKKDEIYFSPVKENPVINSCQAANFTDTKVLWGRIETLEFSVLNTQKIWFRGAIKRKIEVIKQYYSTSALEY